MAYSKNKLNEQEKFWKGKFGDDYIYRNKNNSILKSNIHLLNKIKKHIKNSKSVIEFGCNIGLNLLALKYINKKIQITGVDINEEAINFLKNQSIAETFNESILSIKLKKKYDITFIKGVLIHINPNELNVIYHKLYKHSKKYIYIAEYYNPTPVKIGYRGHKNKLFKRDFVGEFMDKFKNVKLIDYGFAYHRDKYPQDDLNWFLLKKDR